MPSATDPAVSFPPITLPNLSAQSADVEPLLSYVPTLAELTARLGVLPRPALIAAVESEPAIYGALLRDTAETAKYLGKLQVYFSAMADRLKSVGAAAP